MVGPAPATETFSDHPPDEAVIKPFFLFIYILSAGSALDKPEPESGCRRMKRNLSKNRILSIYRQLHQEFNSFPNDLLPGKKCYYIY